jgi:feruloyl-CoA synthase
MPDIISLPTALERRTDGTIDARCPIALGPYPTSITDRLEHWALQTPDHTFLARRHSDGEWRRLSYAQVWTQTRAVAQALLDRGLSVDRPIVILSGNGLEHAVLALAAMHAGIPYAPLAPAYALLARDYTTLRALWRALEPGLVFACEGEKFERPLASLGGEAEVVTGTPGSMASTDFDELLATQATAAVDDAHARVTPETVAKILYTSGSTGRPKGVINTQRMLCANQEMIRTVMPLLESAPILCDWLPWNHTFGGNHNFGIALYNGGTLYIDDGKPMPGAFETTLCNLRDIPVTAYFNVPRGYDLLVPALRADAAFRAHFFGGLKMLFCAAAALRQRVADDILDMASRQGGRRIPLVTGLGATETAPFALCAGDSDFSGGRIGVPVPGVELKLAPVGRQYEARVRGPNVTPGYWRDPELTTAAFDDEGYYMMGDALAFFDPEAPEKGFTFQGRLAEDFKLSTGTWVRVGPLRQRFLAHFGDLATEVVIAGHDRDEVTALVFPSVPACRAICGPNATPAPVREVLDAAAVRDAFYERLTTFAAEHSGHSTAVARLILLEEPPSIDRQELTDKGSVNQKQVLGNRAALVDQLYGAGGAAVMIVGTPVEMTEVPNLKNGATKLTEKTEAFDY